MSTLTPQEKVRRTHFTLAALVASSALLWGGAVLLGLLVLAAVVQWNIGVSVAVANALPYAAIVAALVTIAVMVWRGRFAWSRQRVALWIEERAPELRYALLTAIDPVYASSPVQMQLEPIVARVQTGSFVRRAAARTLLPAFVAVVLTGVGFAATPDEWRTYRPQGAGDNDAAEVTAEMANRLVSIQALVTPPRYTGMPAEKLEDPLTISGITGTRVTVTGHGPSSGIAARLGEQAVEVHDGEDGWVADFSLPAEAAALTLTDRKYSRVVVIDPRPDRAPEVRLTLPEQDLTLRTIDGVLRLEAHIVDDVGIARASFEYIITSGEGEGNITSRTGELSVRTFKGAKAGELSLSIAYADFKLQEGDVLAVSAVALDANDVTGPGKGRSETRNIRVARASEYDELAITPAPPAFDKTAISLRMLIIATEKLAKQRPVLKRDVFVKQSIELGRQGESIRQKLQAIIDEQSGGGMFPVDPLMNEAMNAMWDGVRALNVAEPTEALPPLRTAYNILKKLRDAAKYYVRGRAPPVIVNVDRVRMTGTEPVNATVRKPRPESETARAQLMQQYAQAVPLLGSDQARALEMFMKMRVTALRESPSSAAPLGEVIEALHAGRDAAVPLLKARQAIEGASHAQETLPTWSTGW